ncbi:MAG: M28 family peptidase [Verrucomicrobiales bacterium]|nr:M28 family peptidase [Verrucomicrobiales bacterium]
MTQPTLFKVFLLGLPIGLALIGGGSLLVHSLRGKGGETEGKAAAQRRSVAQADLKFFIERLAKDIGPRPAGDPAALRKTRAFIEGLLAQNNFGYPEVKRQNYAAGSGEWTNLSVEIPGSDPARRGEIVLVAARCDTAALSPGANSSGSGLAALLSLAQAFVGTQHERTLRFVAFGNSLPPLTAPNATGAAACAAAAQTRGEKLAGVLVLGSLGCFRQGAGTQQPASPNGLAWPTEGNFIALLGCGAETPFQKELAAGFAAASTVPLASGFSPTALAGPEFSDLWAFHALGFPAVLLTDTGPFRSPDFQLFSDTPEKIDLAQLTQVTKGIERALRDVLNPRQTSPVTSGAP